VRQRHEYDEDDGGDNRNLKGDGVAILGAGSADVHQQWSSSFDQAATHSASREGTANDRRCPYFSALLMEFHISSTVEPRLVTVEMMTMAMPDASMAYSMEVAPEVSRKNEEIMHMAAQLRSSFEMHFREWPLAHA
jgi:hypothetical protein